MEELCLGLSLGDKYANRLWAKEQKVKGYGGGTKELDGNKWKGPDAQGQLEEIRWQGLSAQIRRAVPKFYVPTLSPQSGRESHTVVLVYYCRYSSLAAAGATGNIYPTMCAGQHNCDFRCCFQVLVFLCQVNSSICSETRMLTPGEVK